MNDTLALALGHVRNAGWQLLGNDQPDGLTLGLDCLDLEALLNPDDIDPAIVPFEAGAADSLGMARQLLSQIADQVSPAAWAVLTSLTAKLG